MQKASKVTVHVSSISDMGRRFTNAWNRAASGKKSRTILRRKDQETGFWLTKMDHFVS